MKEIDMHALCNNVTLIKVSSFTLQDGTYALRGRCHNICRSKGLNMSATITSYTE